MGTEKVSLLYGSISTVEDIPPPPTGATLEEAIETIGNGKFQYKLLLLCGLGWIADAFEMIMLSFLLPTLSKEWGIDSIQGGLITSSASAGMLIGAGVWSILGDIIGRKPSFLLTVLVSSLFGLASAFSPHYWVLLVLRCGVGFGLGGNLPIAYSIFLEYLASERRGLLCVLLSGFFPIGVMFSSALALAVLPTLGWRWLLAFSSVPGFLLLLFRSTIPESPRYLMVVGKQEEAWNVLKIVAKENGKIIPEHIEMSPIHLPRKEKGFGHIQSLKILFNRKYIRTTLTFWNIWFFASIGYYGVSTWLPSYLEKMGISSNDVYANFIVVGFGQLVGLIGTSLVVDKIGRRVTLVVLFLATSAFSILFAVSRGEWMVILFAVLINLTNNGASGVVYTVTPEAFPTKVRSTGIGSCSVWNRTAGMIAPVLGGALLKMPIAISFTLWAGAYFVAAFLAFIIPETTGASLDEVKM
eukprot:TRINITY_DN1660_c0_g1_i2.p1 TRINITY_DN1660_c0_g1~~TRINITY_DN1660_c0_g1_i2.p1  ORF type:complete len:469 (-),score=75.92 TRINITY_DN1660_c0_g1_i2:102-1508(-)